MPNTKHKANSPTVIEIHEEWAVKNGYAQARKRASAQADKLNADNSKRFVEGARPQANKPASAQASSGSRTNKR